MSGVPALTCRTACRWGMNAVRRGATWSRRCAAIVRLLFVSSFFVSVALFRLFSFSEPWVLHLGGALPFPGSVLAHISGRARSPAVVLEWRRMERIQGVL